MKTFNIITTGIIAMLLGCQVVWSDPTLSTDPDAAWQQVQQAAQQAAQGPAPLAVWKTRMPTSEEREQWYKQQGDMAATAAAEAKTFYTQFPDSPHALAAKKMECQMLQMAYLRGSRSPAAYTAWANALTALLADPKLTGDDRFEVRMEIAQRMRVDPALDWKARDAAYEKALRELIKDYPQKERPYQMLIIMAAESSDDQARTIAADVLASPAAPDKAKATARAILRRLDAVGKPVDIQFTAVDGRKVDLSQMKGKVVLVDFWATWCGPCVGEIPHVKEAYTQYHSKGFEVVGISFDTDKNKLTDFIQSHDMSWPQYFDGLQWQNKFGQQFAIDSIPTMWLVDKHGNLYTENAREDLAGQVKKLLAEN